MGYGDLILVWISVGEVWGVTIWLQHSQEADYSPIRGKEQLVLDQHGRNCLLSLGKGLLWTKHCYGRRGRG
jgi:hypothetical protein